MAELRLIAEWFSQFDGKKTWDEVRPIAERTFHRNYAQTLEGENNATETREVGYMELLASARRILETGVVCRVVKIEHVRGMGNLAVEGIFDAVYPDGRGVARLHRVWTFRDGRIVRSHPVRPPISAPPPSSKVPDCKEHHQIKEVAASHAKSPAHVMAQ